METTVEPETVSKWIPVYRDIALTTVGLFMLLWQTVFGTPNPLIIAGAGAALTAPVGFGIDRRRRNGKDHAGQTDDSERWTHLP